MSKIVKSKKHVPATPETLAELYGQEAEDLGADQLPILKFVQGEYLTPDEVKVPLMTELVVNMSEIRRGWLKWEDSEVVDRIMVRISEGKPPARAEIGDTDSNQWPKDDNGAPEDPWSHFYETPMKDPTSGSEYVFSTRSDGGKKAIGRLLRLYRQRLLLGGDPGNPTVELGSTTYYHNKFKRDIDKPIFTVVRWTTDKELLRSAGSTPQSDGGGLPSDDIPF